MLSEMFDNIEKQKNNISTVIDNSIQSHIMAFAAEKSRLYGGKVVKIGSLLDGLQ